MKMKEFQQLDIFDKIVLVGDSQVEFFKASYSDFEFVNLGIAGERINGLCSRLSSILLEKPKEVVFLIGINDVLANKSIKQIIDSFTKLLKVLNNYPVSYKVIEIIQVGHNRNQFNPQITAANKILHSLISPDSIISLTDMGLFSDDMIIDSKYSPPYGKFIVDSDGYLKLSDEAFFLELLDTVDLLDTMSGAEVELFYSDPRTLTTPGVMSLTSTTSNLILENNVPGQPTNVGSLKIKSVPVIQESGSGHCITSFSVNSTTGVITAKKDAGVFSISPGTGISMETFPSGNICISSTSEIEIEEEFSDISLLGASSKLDLTKGYSYIEFGSTEVGLLAKKILPSSRKTDLPLIISVVYSGTGAVRTKLCTGSYQSSWHSLNLASGEFVKSVLFTKITTENTIFFSLYGSNLIVYGVTVQYTK